MNLKILSLLPLLGLLTLTACKSSKDEYAGKTLEKFVIDNDVVEEEDKQDKDEPAKPVVALEKLTDEDLKTMGPKVLRNYYVEAQKLFTTNHLAHLKDLFTIRYCDGKTYEGIDKTNEKALATKNAENHQTQKEIYQKIQQNLAKYMTKESLDTVNEKSLSPNVALSPFNIEALAFGANSETTYELGILAVHIKEEMACAKDELPNTLKMVTNANQNPGTIYPGDALKFPAIEPDRGLYIPTAKGNLVYFRGFTQKAPSELTYLVCPEKLASTFIGQRMVIKLVSSDGLGYPIPGSIVLKGFHSSAPGTPVEIIEEEVETP